MSDDKPTCMWVLEHLTPIRPNKATVLHQYRLECDARLTHWRPTSWRFCPVCGREIFPSETRVHDE